MSRSTFPVSASRGPGTSASLSFLPIELTLARANDAVELRGSCDR